MMKVRRGCGRARTTRERRGQATVRAPISLVCKRGSLLVEAAQIFKLVPGLLVVVAQSPCQSDTDPRHRQKFEMASLKHNS